MSFSPSKVDILTEIAVAHSQSGRRDDALKQIRRAVEAARDAPNDAIWRTSSQPGPLYDRAFDPMAPVLQTIAQAQARIGDLDGALQTVSRISSSGFGKFARKETIEQIVSTRLDAGDVPGALRAAAVIPDSDTMFLDEKASLLERIAKHQSEKSDPALRSTGPENNRFRIQGCKSSAGWPTGSQSGTRPSASKRNRRTRRTSLIRRSEVSIQTITRSCRSRPAAESRVSSRLQKQKRT